MTNKEFIRLGRKTLLKTKISHLSERVAECRTSSEKRRILGFIEMYRKEMERLN